MNKQIETIYNDLSTAGWNIFTSTQSKIDTAEHLANLGYCKINDIIEEIRQKLPMRECRSSEINAGYEWALADVRTRLTELEKKIEEKNDAM